MRAEMMLERYTTLFNATRNIAVKTPFSRLDRNFGGGFYNGELIVFAGRPGIGKTTLLQQMANHQGKYANVLFASAEMSVSSVTDRDIASSLGIHIHQVRQGKYSPELYGMLIGALGELSESKVFYLESKRGASLTTSRIRAAASEMQLRHGLSAIFIDYLGLLTDDFGRNANERLGYISRQLKAIALDLDIPVITAHQLSRAVTQREGNEPQLSDLYESGHIEQDADAIVFIHRPDYYDRDIKLENGAPIPGKLIIAKERQGGETGFVPIVYSKSKSMYYEVEEGYDASCFG
jgi:replicative DNA helicase